jgi:hypothetical protein
MLSQRTFYVSDFRGNHFTEFTLRAHFCKLISQSLNDEEFKQSYVVYIYIDPQKLYALVELKDSRVAGMFDLALKSMSKETKEMMRIKLVSDLFPLNTLNATADMLKAMTLEYSSKYLQQNVMKSEFIGSLFKSIKLTELNEIKEGSVVMIGFPYSKSANTFNCTATTEFRKLMLECSFGVIVNFEYETDLSNLKLFDIGDVPRGISYLQSLLNLSELVSVIVKRGAIPFVIGGSNNQLCYTADGFAKSFKNSCDSSFKEPVIGVVNLNAEIDTSIFCGDSDDYEEKNGSAYKRIDCVKRYAQFAAQVLLLLLYFFLL